RVERGKPHLPVEPWHVRRHEPRPSQDIASLPLELLFLPGGAVVADLDHDLRSRCRHHAKETVAVDGVERRDRCQNRSRPTPVKQTPDLTCSVHFPKNGHHAQHGNTGGDDVYAEAPERRPVGTALEPWFEARRASRQEPTERSIVEQREVENDC